MKILHFTNFYPPPFAGTERYVTDLVANLVKRGHEVHIVYVPIIYTKERALTKFEPPKGATLTFIPDRFSFFKLYQEIKKFNPDVIHTHYLKTGLRAAIIGSILKKPVVCSLLLADEKTKPLRRKIGTRLLAPLFKKIHYIAISNEIEESIKKDVRGAKVRMIPCWTWNYKKMNDANEIWLRKKLNFPKDAKIFLTVSRIVEEKGIRHLIYAANDAIKKRNDAYFAVVGTGAMLEEYKSLVNKLGIGNNFIFLGRLSDSELLDAYKGCDAIIIPSMMDCLFTVTESLAVQKPIISNGVRCATEIIENEKSGLIVDVTNHDEFSGAIVEIIDDADLRNKLIKNAGIKSRDYSPEKCTAEIEVLYKLLI